MSELKDLELIAGLVREQIEEEDRRTSDERNKDFVQLYRANMKAFRGIIKANPVAAQIFYFLVEHMDYGNSLACSMAVLQEVTGSSRTSIWRALSYLQERNHVEITKMGNCNVYHVNANIAWSTWGNMKKYAKFKATVVVSESEQTDSVEVSTSKRASVKEGFYED